MTTVLLISGALFLVLAVVGLVSAVFRHARVRRVLESQRLFPYTLWAKYRTKGWLVGLLAGRRISKSKAELVEAHRKIRLADMQHLRDVLVEMDGLPTIRKGTAALGLSSLFDVPFARASRIPSPYTHPMQYPPYLLPGVPARPFYDPAEFEWTRVLEDSYPIIKRELEQVLHASGAGFKGYMSEHNERVGGWNTFNFFFFGKKVEDNCAQCPETTRILESLPRFERDHVMFSALNPHARIPPHTGPMNGILRAHLGLVVPRGCYIRVGPQEQTWEEGKIMVFDDSFEHEVFNHSDSVRIVLFANFWHPCFSEKEISVLERFRAAYERGPFAMVHEQNQAAKRAHDLEVNRVAHA